MLSIGYSYTLDGDKGFGSNGATHVGFSANTTVGSRSLTLADGRRQLVNPTGPNMNVYSGHGKLFNGTTNSAQTHTEFDYSRSWSFL